MDRFSIKGKKALVTGGASGIGLAISEALLSAGADVVVFYNSSDFKKIKANHRTKRIFEGIKVDLSNRDNAYKAFWDAIKILGSIDILVNSAGIQVREKAESFKLEDWDKVLEVNLSCVFILSQEAAKIMFQNGYGKIINIASMNSFGAREKIPAYVASKGGIAQLTKALAVEWANRGINVNAIAPGYILTEMTKGIWTAKEKYEEVIKRIPAGRWGKPDDLKGAIMFLASAASDYVHGTIIPIDGGYLCK